MQRLRQFDLYRNIPKDLTETSSHGAILSLCATIFMLALFVAELWAFISPALVTNMVIDPSSDALLRINFNITVVDMPCEYATIDVVDVLGTRNDNVTININKWQVDENGIRRSYEGRNNEQRELEHDTHHDLEALLSNGVHAFAIEDTNAFNDWLDNHDYTFVDFYAPWCIWCQRLEPVWEAFAERQEETRSAVTVVKVDCVTNRDLCMEQHIQAFPTLRMFKRREVQAPDYRSDRTVEALVEFANSRLALDEQFAQLTAQAKEAHLVEKEATRTDHPGCMLAGFLLVNRVPGNFHIEARSKHHNLNPAMANLSHVVNHLSFGPTLSPRAISIVNSIPSEYFSIAKTQPINDRFFINGQIHQAMHHFIKVLR